MVKTIKKSRNTGNGNVNGNVNGKVSKKVGQSFENRAQTPEQPDPDYQKDR